MNIKDFISSGILELYVLGDISEKESQEVERMAAANPEVRKEIEEISKSLEKYAKANAVAPDQTVKPFLMAIIDYMERMENGEPFSLAPALNENSKISDYAEWINRPDMIYPDDAEDLHAKILSYTPAGVTALAWIKKSAPQETHQDEYEKFLILEGTCDIIVEGKVHSLVSGDYFAIPLFKNHVVKVTSDIPCKVILERMAA
jgi:mannose-6-phosphate isomerase-like protein (cupin superfamily)